MALTAMKSKSTLKKAKRAGRSVPDKKIKPVGFEMIETLSFPDESTWPSPIIPESFVASSDYVPSSDLDY
jgi:hypothetical protein